MLLSSSWATPKTADLRARAVAAAQREDRLLHRTGLVDTIVLVLPKVLSVTIIFSDVTVGTLAVPY
jgi:hypothetical protein